jgi:hypothetical protein
MNAYDLIITDDTRNVFAQLSTESIITHHWREIAHFSYRSFAERGRGAVYLTSEAQLIYLDFALFLEVLADPGLLDKLNLRGLKEDDFTEAVGAYYPERDVVLVAHSKEIITLNTYSLRPRPVNVFQWNVSDE